MGSCAESTISACSLAWARMRWSTRLDAQMTMSAVAMAAAPRWVSRSGAPGPAPTNTTRACGWLPSRAGVVSSRDPGTSAGAATTAMSHRGGSDHGDVTSPWFELGAPGGAAVTSDSGGACVSLGRAVRPAPMLAARRAGTISVDRYGMSGMSAWGDAGDAVESDSLPNLLGREPLSLNSRAATGEVAGARGAGEVAGAGCVEAGCVEAGGAGRRISAA